MLRIGLSAVLLCTLLSCKREKEVIIDFIASPTAKGSLAPYLFADKNGMVYMTWIEQGDTLNHLKMTYLKNKIWSAPNTITSGVNWFINWADYPIGASDGIGHFMVSMLEKSGAGTYAYNIQLFSSSDGSNWQGPVLLHDDSTQTEHGFVSLIPYQEGFFAAWLDGRNTAADINVQGGAHAHHGAMTLRAAILDYQGNTVKEWELDDKVCDCCQTTAAITSNGPVVIYRNRSDEEVRDIYIVRLVGEMWTEPKAVHDDYWTINACPVNGPRTEAIGNLMAVAWFTSSNAMSEVKVAFSKDGGASFAPPLTLNESQTIGRVDVVMLDGSSAMICWMEGPVIKAAKVYSSGRRDTAIVLSESSEHRSSGFPQMVKSGRQIIFAWTDDEDKIVKTAIMNL